MTKAHKVLSTVYVYTKLNKCELLSLGQRLVSLIVALQEAFSQLSSLVETLTHPVTQLQLH